MFMITNGKCGLSGGPYYGNKININLDNIYFDEKIAYPKGEIGVINRGKSQHPVLVGIDEQQKFKWAIEMTTDSLDIPVFSIGALRLTDESPYYQIYFFNKTYSEPGFVLIKRNGNFKCFCLSAF